jgi:hypothetical protein
MAHGIEIRNDIENHFGVKENFSVFNGETFLLEIKEFFHSGSEEVEVCNDGNVRGYMWGLIRETGTRLYRDFRYRKNPSWTPSSCRPV